MTVLSRLRVPRSLLAAAALAGASITTSVVSTGVAATPSTTLTARVLREGHPGEPDSLDPHLAVAAPSLIVLNDLFEGLMTLDAQGRPTHGAAESYSQSADGKTYTFRLRAGLTWSDGRPLTAGDFLWSMRRLANPETGSTGLAAYIDLFKNGAAVLGRKAAPEALGVAALDDRTLRIELAHPAPYFLSVVALPVFAPVPRHVIETAGRNWARPESFVGNGAFVLSEWRPGEYVRVSRNPRFHDARNVRLDGVVYRAIADLNTGLRLFQAGEIDTLTNFPPDKLDWLRQNLPKELRLSPSLGVTVYVFNHRNPKLRDQRVRRALSLAIDRDLLTTRIIHSGDRPAYGLVTSGLPGYFPPLTAAPGSTSASRGLEARELLRQAGYSADRPLELEILYHTSEEHKKVALAVAAMWQQVGVRTTLRNAERQVVEVSVRNADFEVARGAWFSTYSDPMGLLGNLQAASQASGGTYTNAKFDALILRAQSTVDKTQRLRLLRDAEILAMQDQAVIPLYFIVSRRLVAQRVLGWRDDNLTALRSARWLSLR